MSKNLYVVLFVCVLLLTTGLLNEPKYSLAQSSGSNPSPVELGQAKQQRIVNLLANISNRLDATIARLNNIAGRLESRATKMSDAGVNTEPAVTYIRSAQTDLNKATELASQTDQLVYAVVSSGDPSAKWNDLRAHLLEIKRLTRSAYDNLLKALANLKNPTVVEEIPDPVFATTSSSSVTNTDY